MVNPSDTESKVVPQPVMPRNVTSNEADPSLLRSGRYIYNKKILHIRIDIARWHIAEPETTDIF